MKKKWHLLMIFFFTLIWTAQASAHPNHQIEESEKEKSKMTPINFSLKVNWWFPSNSNVKELYGGFGNEIYSIHFGLPIEALSGWLEPYVEPGFLFERASLKGLNSGRASKDKSELLLVPIRFGLSYTFVPKHWLVAPTIDAAYNLVFFDLEEDGVSVDGNKHLLSTRGGLRILIDRTVNEADWKDFFGLRSAFFSILAGYDFNLVGSGLKLDGFVVGPELGIIF